jgi:hypothetical protein
MRESIVFVVALVASLIARAVPAEEWVSVVKDFKGFDEHVYEVLLDMSSIKVNAFQTRLRTANIKYARAELNADEKLGNELLFSLTSKSFECEAQRIRLDAVEVHFRNGAVQDIDPGGDENSWHPVDDLSARKLMDAVCSFKGMKP